MITVKRLTLEDAKILLEAAEKKARELDIAETICICDDGGHAIAIHRMTGARLTGVEIAMAKAFTAAGHRRATHKFNEPPGGPALPGNEAFGIHAMHPGRFAIFVGGFPVEIEGAVVGGIGVSGGTGPQDTAVARAAIDAFVTSEGAASMQGPRNGPRTPPAPSETSPKRRLRGESGRSKPARGSSAGAVHEVTLRQPSGGSNPGRSPSGGVARRVGHRQPRASSS